MNLTSSFCQVTFLIKWNFQRNFFYTNTIPEVAHFCVRAHAILAKEFFFVCLFVGLFKYLFVKKQSNRKSFCIDYWWISYFLFFMFWHYKFLISPSIPIRSYSCYFVFWSIKTRRNTFILLEKIWIILVVPFQADILFLIVVCSNKSKLEFVFVIFFSLPPYCSKTNQNQIVLSHSNNSSTTN